MENKIVLMIVSLAVLSLTSGLVSAESFNLDVELFQDVSTCPTIMNDAPPLNKDDVPIYIQNFYEFPDTFQLSLELPAGWQGFVEPNFIVDSNEKKLIDPLWITVPDTEPGVYQVSIKAKSGQTGDEITRMFDVEVLSCHHVELTAVESYKEVCREEPSEAYVQIRVANQGGATETFKLSVYQAGGLIDWASGSPSITVPAGEETVLDFSFSPPMGISGEQSFTMKAESTTSYAEDSLDVTLVFKDCYSFEAALAPQELSVCSGDVGEYKLTLTNTGKADVFTITAPEWVEVQETVELEDNEKVELAVTASSEGLGRHEFSITIDPETDSSTEVSSALIVDECRGVAIVVTPESTSLCSGDKALFNVLIKNTGGVSEDVELSTDLGVLEMTTMTLDAKEIKTIDLVVDTKDFTGNKEVTVKAVSGIVEDHATVSIESENCYGADVTITPEEVNLCACESTEVSVEVVNTGKLDDSYTITIGEETKTLEIAAGQSGTAKLDLKAPCDAAESFSQTVEVRSEYSLAEKSVLVNVQEAGNCYAVELINGDYVEVQATKSFAIPVTVKNIGERADSYDFSLEGPAWTYLEPVKLDLDPGSQDLVFVYISAPFDVVIGEYEATITVKSENTEATHKIVIDVTEGVVGTLPTEPEEPEEPVENVTQPEEPEEPEEPSENVSMGGEEDGDVVLNASVNESELPTARVIQLERTTRFIIVGIIVVLIIAILIVRFMTLVK